MDSEKLSAGRSLSDDFMSRGAEPLPLQVSDRKCAVCLPAGCQQRERANCGEFVDSSVGPAPDLAVWKTIGTAEHL